MSRFTIFLVIAFVGFCSTAALKSEKFASFEIVTDIEKFKAENPTVVLTKLEKRQEIDYNLRYTLGDHFSGDRIVASGSDTQSWSTPQDAKLNLQYPTSGTESIISYVDIKVKQSNHNGSAYVIDGGIGQRYIKIVVEASKVTYFQYDTQIYGY